MSYAKQLLVLFLTVFTVTASQAIENSAESAVRAYVLDINDRGVVAVADHLHSSELIRFKGMLVPAMRAAGDDQTIVKAIGVNLGVEEAERMSPREFFLALVRQYSTSRGDTGKLEVVAEVLGAVEEAELLHVVSRTSVRGGALEFTRMEVVSLKKEAGHWKVLLSGGIEGIAQMIRKQLAQQ